MTETHTVFPFDFSNAKVLKRITDEEDETAVKEAADAHFKAVGKEIMTALLYGREVNHDATEIKSTREVLATRMNVKPQFWGFMGVLPMHLERYEDFLTSNNPAGVSPSVETSE